jgi:hypothetical protein
VIDKVLCDKAIIHHVEEATKRKLDQHAFQCWAFSKDPSKIPQVVFLTLVGNGDEACRDPQIHFVRPREVEKAHMFKVFIHIDVVEDLLFYNYPCEELVVDGKIPWREFAWQRGRPDGEVEEE